MARDAITSDDLSAPDLPFSMAVRGGGLLFFSGQVATDPATGKLIGGDITQQTEQVLRNLAAALAAAGASLADVLKTTVYVASADQSDLVAVWEVVHTAFDPHDAPSTLLGVSVLGYSGQLVEIEAVALAPAASSFG